MPRKGRLHISGGCYHVIGRGLERRCIFSEVDDKNDFLNRLGENLSRSQAQCLAWALMSNHYHLLIRVGSQSLSQLMAPLLGGFGGSYNRRHGRVGFVFQNRFKSILCDEDNYLLELIRYIHLNPVRAKMVSDLKQLDHYPWTGHSGLIGNNRFSGHAIDDVFCLFGETRKRAIRVYRGCIRDGFDDSTPDEYSRGDLIRSNGGWESSNRRRSEHAHRIGDERILGSGRFVEKVLAIDKLGIDKKTLWQQQGWTFDILAKRVCDVYGINEQSLTTKARRNKLSIVKSLICYWGVEELGLTMTEISLKLGVSQQSISMWVMKGRLLCQAENKDLEGLEN